MKKAITILILAATLLVCLSGCGNKNETVRSDKAPVVTTIFPIYDWVSQIAGGRADITLLLDNGVDLHSYQPTADDIITISTSDLFIFVGGESDGWVEDVIARASNDDLITVDLLEVLGDKAREEEIKEGMQTEEEESEDEDEEEVEYDEHVWLSLKNAALFCREICDALSRIDPDGAKEYKKNSEEYIAKLNDLDARYEEAVENAEYKTLLFGDRFPFRYLTEDYGLDYFAAFVGCSAESEASFETVTYLASKVDELGLPAIMQIETADGRLAGTVRDATASGDVPILTLDSMQSSTVKDIKEGKTYLEVMENNLAVLKKALG